ncbi:MAG TPA: fibronectin type III-like domain-contianing protein [Jatrophihabitans sp.]|nr:fibronectin type III-like domain-contianing protein [Jatrophihabitans sp.]
MIRNPGDIDCSTEPAPTFDNCYFISNVDNGWYASGLIVARQAMPELRHLVDSLIQPMNFGIFYDARSETHCNTNPAIAGNQPTGQMYGGYYAGLPPDQGDNWTHFRLGRNDVGFYDNSGQFVVEPGRIDVYVGDSSQASLTKSFAVR